ncbi:hypothetical protein [Butyrivibrio sp. AC2005]|uniref:hypothetical protein n=1 Tax=Butyrivibrio sp. AC2005 TaxID=1280672 RepID=UPI00040A30B1|nr:hypothetical protein [Butyrivibrio sp. AC2005]
MGWIKSIYAKAIALLESFFSMEKDSYITQEQIEELERVVKRVGSNKKGEWILVNFK